VWDKDLFAPDDSIGERTLDLKALCKRVLSSKTQARAYLVHDGERDFTLVGLANPNPAKESKGGTLLPNLKMQVQLVPKVYADKHKVGVGQDQPNMFPYLPAPEGRLNFSLMNPAKLCYEIIGPDWCCKVAWAFILSAIITGLLYMGPEILAYMLV